MARRDFLPGSYGFEQVRSYRRSSLDLFRPHEQPRYFGTGDYGSGEGAFTGGYAELRGRADRGFEMGSWPRERLETPMHEERSVGRRLGRPPKNFTRTDERIREDVCERLIREERIDASDVEVNVRGGIVVFDGTVPDRFMKYALEYEAEACPGVRDVENRVGVRNRESRQAGCGALNPLRSPRSAPR